MKLKVLIAALFVAGFASSFALAGGTRGAVETTTGTTGTTTTGTTTTTHTTTRETTTGTTHTATPDKPRCHKVELQGSNGTGSVSFTVDHASKRAQALGGTAVTLAFAGARVHATACVDAAGVLTLSHLELSTAKPEKNHDDANHNSEGDHKKGEHGKR